MEIHDIDVGWLDRERWVMYVTDGDSFVLYVRPSFAFSDSLASFVLAPSLRGGSDRYSVSYAVHSGTFTVRLRSFEHGLAILRGVMDCLSETGHLRFLASETDLVWVYPQGEPGDYVFVRFMVDKNSDVVSFVVSVSRSLTIFDMRLPFGSRMLIGAWQHHNGLFGSVSESSSVSILEKFRSWFERYRLLVRRVFRRG